MKPAVAEQLSNFGVKLLNHFGATELGPLAPIANPGSDYDWRYLRVRRDVPLRIVPVDVEDRSEAHEYKLVGESMNAGADWTLPDRLALRPGFSRDICILSRNDDVIVLSNGEKVMPQTLELALSAVPGVRTALAFGNGQFEIGTLIEQADASQEREKDGASGTTDTVEELRKRIWNEILVVNPALDAHARVLTAGAICILPAGTRLPRSDKGSVMRKEAYHIFEEEISAVYQLLESSFDSGSAGSTNLETGDLPGTLKRLVKEYLPHVPALNDKDDVFELGLDSLCAARLQRQIDKLVTQTTGSKAARSFNRFVYKYSTIGSMSAQLQLILDGKFSEVPGDNDAAGSSPGLSQQLLEEISRTLQVVPGSGEAGPGAVVLLTGSSGSIGSHLLALLMRNAEVERVVCLDRPLRRDGDLGHQSRARLSNESITTDLDQWQRQKEAFSRHGIEEFDAALWSKVTALATTTREDNLGLSELQYQGLLHSVTHVIHNAWPMDFNRSVSSFTGQFTALRNLLRLAIDARGAASSSRQMPTRFVFNSSIAVLANYAEFMGIQRDGVTDEPVEALEAPVDDPRVASPMGYAQAKWVCEKLTEEAARLHPTRIDASIIRIGQVTGSTRGGAWSTSEHVPALLKTIKNLGSAPNIEGVSTTCRDRIDPKGHRG